MTSIRKVEIPQKSIIRDYLTPIDYADSFKMKIPDEYTDGIDDITLKSFGRTPAWISGLMKLRNAIVSPLGLKTGIQKQKNSPGILKAGDKAGLFTVIKRTDTEIIMGEQDKHLDFCVSVYLNNENSGRHVTITTVVKFNNWFGRFYFMFVRPLHKIIVPASMKYNLNRL